jgi:hypothetical protein
MNESPEIVDPSLGEEKRETGHDFGGQLWLRPTESGREEVGSCQSRKDAFYKLGNTLLLEKKTLDSSFQII